MMIISHHLNAIFLDPMLALELKKIIVFRIKRGKRGEEKNITQGICILCILSLPINHTRPVVCIYVLHTPITEEPWRSG